MKRWILKNKFLVTLIIVLIGMTFVDYSLTFKALDNTFNQILSMLIIVPPIFVLIGLFDVWVPKETVIRLMGEGSKAKGMFLAFFLGGFSAGPTIGAFPLAMVMLKKGASYTNVIFFLMVWSSLKLPIVFYQITTIGLKFSLIINLTMLAVFIISALMSGLFFTEEDKALFYKKANE
ncbi:MAG: permease [Candidatus Izemoplasmataceae bacterium]